MGIRRSLLYSAYRICKSSGYISLRNRMAPSAKIVTFHRVNPYDNSFLSTSTEMFETLMQIVKKDYVPTALEALVQKVRRKDTIDPRTIAVTFDDGYKDNFMYAAPILKKHGIPATFFVTSGYINTDRIFPWDKDLPTQHPLMTWDEVRELHRLGFSIGAHTINHVDLGTTPLAVARIEVIESKEHIEQEIGGTVRTFAAPFGGRRNIRDEIVDVIREAGYDCCCTAYGGNVTSESDPYHLRRVSMYPSIEEMLMELDNFMTYLDGKMSFGFYGVSREA